LVAADGGVCEELVDRPIYAFVPDTAVALPSDGSIIKDNSSVGKQMFLECPSSFMPYGLPFALRLSGFHDFEALSKFMERLTKIPRR
jgi:hypothetical protein